jgi:hypothetical protein
LHVVAGLVPAGAERELLRRTYVLDAVGEPNLKVQMDLYHCQIVEGNVDTKLRQFEFDSSSSSALHRFASGLESLPLN